MGNVQNEPIAKSGVSPVKVKVVIAFLKIPYQTSQKY